MSSSSVSKEVQGQLILYRRIGCLVVIPRSLGLIVSAFQVSQLIIRTADIYNRADIYYPQSDLVTNAVAALGGLAVIAVTTGVERYCNQSAQRLSFEPNDSSN